MALQLWDTFKESITAYTGLSPSTFFTVIALGLAVYYTLSSLFGSSGDDHPSVRSRGFEEKMEPLPPPVQLGEITDEELKLYDGSDPKKPLLMAIKGQIYDVSQSSQTSPENVFFTDEEALFGMPRLIDNMAEGLMLPVPASTDAKDIQNAAAEAANAFGQPNSVSGASEEATTMSPENVFFTDEEALFGMPRLIDNMAEGLMLPPPYCMDTDVVDSYADVSLWSYSI